MHAEYHCRAVGKREALPNLVYRVPMALLAEARRLVHRFLMIGTSVGEESELL